MENFFLDSSIDNYELCVIKNKDKIAEQKLNKELQRKLKDLELENAVLKSFYKTTRQVTAWIYY